MDFPKLGKEIYQKNAKKRMRVPWAVKVHSQSQLQCIERYIAKLAHRIPLEHWTSCKNHITKTDRWVDVMNHSYSKGCEPIDSADHRHNYELLSYAEKSAS